MVPPPGVGLGTRFHALPSHRRIRLMPGPHPQLMSPTAQALLADVAATPKRKSARPLLASGLGLGTRVHAVPFQRTTRDLTLVPAVKEPTAQAVLAAGAATPDRAAPGGGRHVHPV